MGGAHSPVGGIGSMIVKMDDEEISTLMLFLPFPACCTTTVCIVTLPMFAGLA